VHGQQFSGEPQIDDAPVNRRKAFLNVPTLHPASINAYRSWSRDGALLGDGQAGSQAIRSAAGEDSSLACMAEPSKSW
jgi:hypothetical protein